MDQVFTFDKSLDKRLREYGDVLAGYDVLPVSGLEKEWGFYLELTLDTVGWQAVWKIQRRTCEVLNIPFPAVVLVIVLNLDFKELTALVKVLAVQDDIHIPDKHYVPLMHLWPTKEQDKSVVLNLHSTANALDMLRFFYNHVFMPWDHDDDDTIDWKAHHLESRLRLYYDMKNGVIPRDTAEHLHSLITEAKRIQTRREEFECELEDIDDDPTNNKVQSFMELHIRLMEIKAEVDILENPLLRDAIIRKHKNMNLGKDDAKQHTWVIMHEGTAAASIEFLKNVHRLTSDEVLKFSSELYTSLDCANANDTFILAEAKHMVKTTGALEHGGILKGVSTKESTILTSDVKDVMLDFKGDFVKLENLTIEAVAPQCAIIVRCGQLTLENCKLFGDGKSSTHQGIIVLNGAKLVISKCEISRFCTAVIGNSGSVITIENSEIFDCDYGIKVYDNSALTALKSTVKNCKKYGVCVEVENNLNGGVSSVGDFDILNIIPKLQMECINGSNNNADAAINQKSKLTPIEDIFGNPDMDPTICMESDDDMDTVIENSDGRASPATV